LGNGIEQPIIQVWLILRYQNVTEYDRKRREYDLKMTQRNTRKTIIKLLTSDSIDSQIEVNLKRPLEHTEVPPPKRQALESLSLSGDLERAKQAFAALIDNYMNGRFEEENETAAEFIQANTEITQKIRKRERTMSTRTSVLCAPNYSLRISQACLEKLKSSRSGGVTRSDARTRAIPTITPKGFTPIIVVPKAGMCPISSDVAVQFFTEGKLPAPAKEVRRRAGHSKVETFRYKHTTFEVMDSIVKLPQKDWHRIVAVFVSGMAWQFEGPEWQRMLKPERRPNDNDKPCTNNIPNLFKKIKGFYLQSEDAVLPTAVANWNVDVLTINYNKSYTVQTAQLKFWELLKDHLAKIHFVWGASRKSK